MRFKNFVFLFVFIGLFLILVGCGNTDDMGGSRTTDKKLMVYTTIYPLSDFAAKIAGNNAIVTNIVPPGTEPHDFEPTPKDIMKLNQADLFIYNGAGFEQWANKVVGTLANKHLIVVDSSKNLTPLAADESVSPQEKGKVDPHFWLDPNQAIKQAQAIKDALVQADPQHQANYEKNFEQLGHQFKELDNDMKDLAAHAKLKEMIVSHAAFGYLAKAYGFKEIAVSGINPSDEPTPKDLQKIIETVKKDQIHYILFETLAPKKIAEVVKNETNTQALPLNSLESLTEDQLKQGKDYFTVMRDNMETLKLALNYSK